MYLRPYVVFKNVWIRIVPVPVTVSNEFRYKGHNAYLLSIHLLCLIISFLSSRRLLEVRRIWTEKQLRRKRRNTRRPTKPPVLYTSILRLRTSGLVLSIFLGRENYVNPSRQNTGGDRVYTVCRMCVGYTSREKRKTACYYALFFLSPTTARYIRTHVFDEQ